jgi:hypothetical protein
MARAVSRYRTFLEWSLSIVSVTTIVLVMYASDTPVRQYANAYSTNVTHDRVHMRMPEPLVRAGRTAWRICMDNQQLAGFAGVATVLVLFMRRMR